MNGKQAKELFIKHSEKRFNEMGFYLQKTRDTEALFFKINESSLERIGISTKNYSPEVVFGFGTGKRINIIEDILFEMNKNIEISNNLNKKTTSLNYFGRDRNRLDLKLFKVSDLDKEEGVITSSEIILDFMENQALPVYNLFEDIREIDKRINSEGENYWDDDWKKEFSLAHYFDIRRLIIAKLAGNERFDEIVDRSIKYIERETEKNTGKSYAYDRNDLSNFIPFTVHYLKDTKSLY